MKTNTGSMMGPDASTIAKLKAAGYTVRMVSDQDPPIYAWMNTASGASQSDVKDRQPFRRSEAQAWADCKAYDSLNVPSVSEPDWIAR